MEIIDCAETHGLLEARTPCFSIQVVDLALWAPENSSKCLQPQVAQIIEGDMATWPLTASKLLAVPGESNFSGAKTDLSCFLVKFGFWNTFIILYLPSGK